MESELFALFQPANLRRCLEADGQPERRLLEDFGRFLAAYYANLPVFACRDGHGRVPSLWLLSEKGQLDEQGDRILEPGVSSCLFSSLGIFLMLWSVRSSTGLTKVVQMLKLLMTC